MQTNEFIYVISKSLPRKNEQGKLTINLQYKEKYQRVQISLSWLFSFESKNRITWTGCLITWEESNYELIPLLQKMQEADINGNSEVKDVISFLRNNNIEQAIETVLYNKQRKEVYSGYITLNEIVDGEFERRNCKEPYRILRPQQKTLLMQIVEQRNYKQRKYKQ